MDGIKKADCLAATFGWNFDHPRADILAAIAKLDLECPDIRNKYHNRMSAKPPTEYERFTSLVDHVLSVPKPEIQRREQEYRKQVQENPRKRGPKRKASASHDPAAS